MFNPSRPVAASHPSDLMSTSKNLLLLAAVAALVACGSKEEAEKAAKNAPTPSELIANQPMFHGPEIKNVELQESAQSGMGGRRQGTV